MSRRLPSQRPRRSTRLLCRSCRRRPPPRSNLEGPDGGFEGATRSLPSTSTQQRERRVYSAAGRFLMNYKPEFSFVGLDGLSRGAPRLPIALSMESFEYDPEMEYFLGGLVKSV